MKTIGILSLILSVLLSSLSADGGLFVYDRNNWRLIEEGEQFCAINHRNGVQKMILSVSAASELQGEKLVWVFPVPAAPEKVEIDITKGFPVIRGERPELVLKKTLEESFVLMAMSQIYPPLVIIPGLLRARASASENANLLTIHKRLEKMGLTTELVSTKDSHAFAKYLADKNLKLPGDFQQILDGYIGQQYSFVVSWVSDLAKFIAESKDGIGMHHRLANAIGIYLTFPTEKMYYPLKPTSIYGPDVVRTTIYTMDFVEPSFNENMIGHIRTTYYYHANYIPDEHLRDFFSFKPCCSGGLGRTGTIDRSGFDLRYTKVEIDAPSYLFTEDLWFEKTSPARIEKSIKVLRYIFPLMFVLFIILSCISSLIAGKVAFGKISHGNSVLLLLGLANILTLIGLCTAVYFVKIEKIEDTNKPKWLLKMAYILMFTALFLVSVLICMICCMVAQDKIF